MEDVEELFKAKNSKEYQDGYLDALSDVVELLAELPLSDALASINEVLVRSNDE